MISSGCDELSLKPESLDEEGVSDETDSLVALEESEGAPQLVTVRNAKRKNGIILSFLILVIFFFPLRVQTQLHFLIALSNRNRNRNVGCSA